MGYEFRKELRCGYKHLALVAAAAPPGALNLMQQRELPARRVRMFGFSRNVFYQQS
jgi:hypothetical protein